MEQFIIEQVAKTRREMDTKQILGLLNSYGHLFWSWGARGFTNIGNKFLKFRVSGHHHKGYVYISCNGLDLMTIHLVSTKGVIKKEFDDIYIDDLFEVIDNAVERIPDYIN